MNRKGFTLKLDPGKRGLRKILGDLEHDIMAVLWDRGKATVRQVHQQLGNGREIAYTTVMTVMSRLGTKGLLAKSRIGNAFVYTPTYTREQFTQFSLKKVFSGLLRDFSAPAIHQFVESLGSQRPEELAELARAVKKMRQKTNA